MDKKEKNTYIAYEYKEVVAKSDKAQLLIDGYENFGWETEANIIEMHNGKVSTKQVHGKLPDVLIRMKRNRKIVNKMELTRLQKNFEACVKQIEELEKRKTSLATIYALICGIVGTAFIAGSVFAVTANPPIIWLCIILAVPGFIGWILPYYIYNRTKRKETDRIEPMIEEKMDEIYELCEKGNRLMN